ncbi:PRC-barrel-containing protein-like protein [Anaeromyces robustus]|uniref:PRC-barrel-containing protein-like protein n=1 Tax=Anaeromyces robustus TaxID=1754192 RepID=A0A1Y1WX04_9FUNG|nr:PRC-barrel-containing protein-like protein [Anaeromyces robustus]|eukprot:ORX78077.1 PRC-barrel-containing protein-like protein [Anaeromyces robustus]
MNDYYEKEHQPQEKIKNYSGKLIYDLNNDDDENSIYNNNNNNNNNHDPYNNQFSNSITSSRASSARKSISFFVSTDDDNNGTDINSMDLLQDKPESSKQIKKKEIILKRLEMSRKANHAHKNSENKSKIAKPVIKPTKLSKSDNISLSKEKEKEKDKKDKKSHNTNTLESVIEENNKENNNNSVINDLNMIKNTEPSLENNTEIINQSHGSEPNTITTNNTTPSKTLHPTAPTIKIDNNHHIKSNIHMRKFKLPNNKNLMKNALNTILGGKINEKMRKEAIQCLNQSDQNHFIILFQNNEQHSFRGLYSFNPEDDDQSVKKIFSINGNKSNTSSHLLPEIIHPSDVYEYYKYDTGSRSFQKVHTKSFQRTTHACALIPSYFKRGLRK